MSRLDCIQKKKKMVISNLISIIHIYTGPSGKDSSVYV